jgi:hypothetical protein
MQLSLQVLRLPIRHRQAISGLWRATRRGYVRVFVWFRPMGNLRYEHMFSSTRQPRHRESVAGRLCSAVLLIRSFLLLEDDYVRDWEVAEDERGEFVGGDTSGHSPGALRSELGGSEGNGHPHRMALRSRLRDRRPGEVAANELVCVCPVAPRERRGAREVSVVRG